MFLQIFYFGVVVDVRRSGLRVDWFCVGFSSKMLSRV
jgi:hypothetical protein